MAFLRKVSITVAITFLGKVAVAVAITKKNVANPTLSITVSQSLERDEHYLIRCINFFKIRCLGFLIYKTNSKFSELCHPLHLQYQVLVFVNLATLIKYVLVLTGPSLELA